MRRMAMVILGFLVAWYLPIALGIDDAYGAKESGKEQYSAVVKEVVGEKLVEGFGGKDRVQVLEVEFLDGERKGEVLKLDNDGGGTVNTKIFKQGDKVQVVHYEPDIFYVVDYQRGTVLLVLFGLFAGLVMIVGSWSGGGSLLAMVFSFLVLFRLVLPLILSGFSPVWAAIAGAILIIPFSFYISHGLNRKTTIAVLATLITLVITGLLSLVFAQWAHLSGAAGEEVNFLSAATRDKVDFSGLLLAGMIISLLGILDDITISQASVVQQLKGANRGITFGELYWRAMSVGRDHISSLVNTLILVYAGASMPLLLLFFEEGDSLLNVLNYEMISEEVVRTLIGSIGIVMAVPLATILAVWLVAKAKKGEKVHVCGCGHQHWY